MPIYSYKEGWKLTKLEVKLNNNWKSTASCVYINGAWKKTFRPVPPGLIIPYNGTTAPAGWSLFTAANGRFIVGAGKTYAVKSTGGSSAKMTFESTSNGAHTGKRFQAHHREYDKGGENTAGSHSHTISFNYTPKYYGLSLIKSVAINPTLPPQAIMFADCTMPGLTRFTDGDGMMFVANNSIGSGGSNIINPLTSTTSGQHTHGNSNTNSDSSDSCYVAGPKGNHSHSTASFTISPNLKRVLLSAWTNISKSFALKPGMYGFYEGTVPPEGWALCDGTNDTLDLRDHFIEFTDEENHGTKTGDGTINIPDITLQSYPWTHNHIAKTNMIPGSRFVYHYDYSATHSHTVPASAKTFLPPYYALSIITLKS